MPPPTCERCTKPLTLTRHGKLRKGKRFCSVRCQQENIALTRLKARNDLAQILMDLQRVLHVLGMT